jgi:hypothetical protein
MKQPQNGRYRVAVWLPIEEKSLVTTRPAAVEACQSSCFGTRAAVLRPLAACCLLLVACAGCVTSPYRVGSRDQYYNSQGLAELTDERIERGQPRPVLDTAGWIVGIPSKIILWNSRVDNHNISPETEAAIAEYLAENELWDVKVRLNQYAPLDEWRRLTKNEAVAWPWRYTLGTLQVAGDAIFPGRLFGGSHFNPFTNSVHLYSDVPAEALHEAGHAKDWARRKWKGTYAAVYAIIPGAPLWHEAVATNDALSYLRERGTYEEQQAAYRLLYPAYGTYVGGTAGDLLAAPAGALYVAGVVGGHVAGRIKAAQIRPETSDHESTSEISSGVYPLENAIEEPVLELPQ